MAAVLENVEYGMFLNPHSFKVIIMSNIDTLKSGMSSYVAKKKKKKKVFFLLLV